MTFEDWKSGFLGQTAGVVPSEVITQCEPFMRPLDTVTKADSTQAEARKTFWQYLDLTVTNTRIAKGQELLNKHAKMFDKIENQFPVPREIVAAIWGMESNFGAIRGDIPVLTALSAMAHQGRRRALFEDQLHAAFQIVANDQRAPENMLGSWAGAMGHTQFMPRAYLEHALSATDASPNIWDDDPADALLSTANYLTHHGWTQNATALIEVTLPKNLDIPQARNAAARSLEAWNTFGIQTLSSSNQNTNYRFLLPSGHNGPAFLISQNYDAILKYNNAHPYAVAVAHLAQRLAGQPRLQTPRQDDPRGLTLKEMKTAQETLTRLGFDTQGADGFNGPNTINALEAFQQTNGRPVDGHLDLETFKFLNSFV